MAYLSPASKKALANLRAYASPPTNWFKCPLQRRAAVLILLFADRRGDLRVVLTIRSSSLTNFAGHAALPGGKSDSLTETPFATARREALEEIGLPLSDDELPEGYSVEHLTELPANLAMTELGVRPCVAYLKRPAQSPLTNNSGNSQDGLLPKVDAREVAAVFTAPFYNFLREQDVDEKIREKVPGKWYQGSWISWHESPWKMHQFFVPVTSSSVLLAKKQGGRAPPEKSSGAFAPPSTRTTANDQDEKLAQPRYRVWGMTARILVDCARVAYGEEPEYEHNSHFGDEAMIEKLLKMGRLQPVKTNSDGLTREVMQKAAKIKL